jgi:hypothetical protein
MKSVQLLMVVLFTSLAGGGLALPKSRSLEETELLARVKRNTDVTAAPLNVSFTVLSPMDPGECYGGSSAGLGDTTLRLEFRSNASRFQWMEVAGDIPTDVGAYSTTVSAGCGCVEFRLVQEEHGGGECNCWTLQDVDVNGSRIPLQMRYV